MKTLVLGTIPDNFSPSTHHALGPWCFIGKEHVFENWESLDFEPDPFASAEEISGAADSTVEYANAVFPAIVEKLNSMNGTQHSLDYWRMLVMPYLLMLVQTTWERQLVVRQFLSRHADQRFKVELVEDSIRWHFRDTRDFIYRGILNAVYNEWLFSRLLEDNVPASWTVTTIRRTIPEPSGDCKEESLRTQIAHLIRSGLRCQGVYGISLFGSFMWSAFLSVKPAARDSASVSSRCDLTTDHLHWGIGFEQLIWKTLPEVFYRIGTPPFPKPRAKKGKANLIGGELLWFNEPDKRRFASKAEGGEVIVAVQHGGNYGTLKSAPLISELEYKLNGFFTWGWERHEGYEGLFCPMPSPYLSRAKASLGKRNCSKNLVLVGTVSHLRSYRFDSVPQAVQQIEARANKCHFLEGLAPEVLRETSYRPYPLDKQTLLDRSYFSERYPGLRMLDGKWKMSMLRARLLVLDHPVTTLNIALAANVPTIGFWDKNAWAMSCQALPYFDALEEAGVFFQTGEDAANKVNDVWEHLEEWWNQESIQSARREWCHRYARTSRFWWAEWARTLWKL